MEPNKKTLKPKAFPNAFWRDSDGMDLRDYFAAKAMQGICAHSGGASPVWAENNSDIAEVSYELADAMMKAREA